MTISYIPLSHKHFEAIIHLGNQVHGDNYLDKKSLLDLYERSWSKNINASWVAVLSADEKPVSSETLARNTPDGYLIGFRLTVAPDQWIADEWCSPTDWGFPKEQVSYFKCNTVDYAMRGCGVGSTLLKKSIVSSQRQGALAGVAHIWLASPGNSAFGYFAACGGELLKKHPNKWQQHSIEDNYECPVCGDLCTCTAAEMILQFDKFAS